MNDTGGAGSVEGFGDLRCETHDFFDREHAIGSMLSKRLAFDQLHGDEADPVGLADLVNGRDPRMRDRGGSPRLAQEAVAAGFVSGNLGGEDLEGHRPLQALVPDAVFYLKVSPEHLVQRNLAKNHALDYWESGMDLGLSRDMFDSFIRYQAMMAKQFERLQKTYGFHIIDGDRPPDEISHELQRKTEAVLAAK